VLVSYLGSRGYNATTATSLFSCLCTHETVAEYLFIHQHLTRSNNLIVFSRLSAVWKRFPSPLILTYFTFFFSGELMPNDRSTDTNANKRVVILRCKMDSGEDAYMNLARSNEEIDVEIFRETVSLISFIVPWKTRVQSRFLSGPSDRQDDASTGTSKNPRSSIFDPWMGFNRSTPGVWQREKLFMCVPGLESPISRKVRNF
jgi:hypothetical protein